MHNFWEGETIDLFVSRYNILLSDARQEECKSEISGQNMNTF